MQSLMFVCRYILLNETYREEMKKALVELRYFKTIFANTTQRIGRKMGELRIFLRIFI
jgi:hypothetical protein